MNLFRPVNKVYPITQGWMENPSWYPTTGGHMGLDYGCPEGTPVQAVYDGVVSRAELDTQTAQAPGTGYGLHVRIKHQNGYTSVYGHLSQIHVKVGQVVKAGEVIGLSGNTGRSTGAHLHLEVRAGESILSCIDITDMMVDDLPPSEPLFSVEVTAQGKGVRLRSGPGKNYSYSRNLAVGEKVDVLGIAGDDVWLWTGAGYISYEAAWYKPTPGQKKIIVKKPPRPPKGETS